MSDAPARRRVLSSADATLALGGAFAHTLPPGRAPLVLYLQGELGAGKTTFARGMLRALGVTGTVRSPSYTLLEQYAVARGLALHMDLYRLAGEDEFEQLGSRDHFEPGSLWLIEWPERAPRGLPPADLAFEFGIRDQSHEVRIEARSPAGREWLGATLPEG